MTLTDLPYKKHSVGGLAPKKSMHAVAKADFKTSWGVREDGLICCVTLRCVAQGGAAVTWGWSKFHTSTFWQDHEIGALILILRILPRNELIYNAILQARYSG